MTRQIDRARPAFTRYEIRDASGQLVALHCREDLQDGGKRLWWEQPDGSRTLGGLALADLPLYGIDRLGADSRVVVCEGEKAADVLWSLGIQAVGTVTGAASCPSAATLAELTGRHVVVWPDNDAFGQRHMDQIATCLAGVAASVSRVEWSDAPPHGDAADFAAAGRRPAEVRALLASAVPVDVAPPPPDNERPTPRSGRRPGARDRLLATAENAQFFRSPEGNPYVDVTVDGNRMTLRIGSAAFANWLRRAFWEQYHEAAPEQAVKEAMQSLAARAVFGAVERPVHLRVGGDGAARYIDLADAQGRAIEITSAGWALVTEPAARFRRGSSSRPLPVPVRGGTLDELLGFLNVDDPGDQRLVLAWLIDAAVSDETHAPLILGGEQDAGKSTTARVLRRVLDPDDTPLTPAPRDEEDLLVVASDNALLVLDNLSHLPDVLSDALCRLADGTGFKRRARYTDSEVAVIRAKRPVILTGIGELATRGDLLSRAIVLRQPPINPARRRSEAAFWAAFDAATPRILGALCDALVGVLRELPGVDLANPPRMADFARVGVALERALGWQRGSFLAAFADNRAAGSQLSLEAYPIVDPLFALAQRGSWEGSSTELLRELERRVPDPQHRRHRWPGAPNALSGQLDRLAPALRGRGIIVERSRRQSGSWITIHGVQRDIEYPIVTTVTEAPMATGGAFPGANPSVNGSSSAVPRSSLRASPVTVTTIRDDPTAPLPSAGIASATTSDRTHDRSNEGANDDADDRSSSLLPEGGMLKQGTDLVRSAAADLQSLLASGVLETCGPVRLSGGETVDDVALAARGWLAELDRGGIVGAAARGHLARLADALGLARAARWTR